METKIVHKKNKWRNQQISHHFNNRKKKQYKHWDRRWSRKHTNSAKIYNGPGPNGCNCCEVRNNELGLGPATDANRRNLSMDPQIAALNKKYSNQRCLNYEKINSNDSNIESTLHKLHISNKLQNISFEPTHQSQHCPVTLNEFLPKQLQSNKANHKHKNIRNESGINYSGQLQYNYKPVININKIMISMNNHEYGLISKRLYNLITKYHIIQTLLPHIKKIKKLTVTTNTNHDIRVDSLIKKKYVSKLNNETYGKYDIVCVSKTHLWTDHFKNIKNINVGNTIVTDRNKYNNIIMNMCNIQLLVYGYWRSRTYGANNKSTKTIITVDIINLCLCYCDIINMANHYQSLLPYNFHVKQWKQKTKSMVRCYQTSQFRLRHWDKMFICLVFKDKKKNRNGSCMCSLMNIIPMVSISKMDHTPIEPGTYWRRGPGCHSYTWPMQDTADKRIVRFRRWTFQ